MTRALASLLLLFTLNVAAQAPADAETPERERLARVVFDKMRLNTMLDAMVQQMMIAMEPMVAQDIARSKVPPEHRDRATAIFMDKLNAEINGSGFRTPYTAAAVRTYASEFSRRDLEAVIQFYDSETGRKLLEKQVPILQSLSQLGRQLGEAAGRRAGEATFKDLRDQGMLAPAAKQ